MPPFLGRIRKGVEQLKNQRADLFVSVKPELINEIHFENEEFLNVAPSLGFLFPTCGLCFFPDRLSARLVHKLY